MVDIVISIPNNQAARVQAAFARRVGKEQAPESVTIADVKGELVSLIRKIVRQHEQEAAERNAREGIEDVTPT